MTEEEQKLAKQIFETLDMIDQKVQVLEKGFDRIENKIEWTVEEIKRDRNDRT